MDDSKLFFIFFYSLYNRHTFVVIIVCVIESGSGKSKQHDQTVRHQEPFTINTIEQMIHQGRGGDKVDMFTVNPDSASKEIF